MSYDSWRNPGGTWRGYDGGYPEDWSEASPSRRELDGYHMRKAYESDRLRELGLFFPPVRPVYRTGGTTGFPERLWRGHQETSLVYDPAPPPPTPPKTREEIEANARRTDELMAEHSRLKSRMLLEQAYVACRERWNRDR
jgi:hypothetical protein